MLAMLVGNITLCVCLYSVLSGKYNHLMNSPGALAASLGRLGGQARARRLDKAELKRISALGGAARKRSIDVARRVAENFAYAAAVEELRKPGTAATRVSTCRGPLPGLYPDRK